MYRWCWPLAAPVEDHVGSGKLQPYLIRSKVSKSMVGSNSNQKKSTSFLLTGDICNSFETNGRSCDPTCLPESFLIEKAPVSSYTWPCVDGILKASVSA